MSAISSVGSDTQSLLLQQAQQRLRTGQGGQAGFVSAFNSRFEDAAKAAGVDPAKLPDLEKQIQQAVQGVSKGTDGSGDNHAAVRDAIDDVLKKNGIDPEKIKAQFAAKGGGVHKHHGHHGAHAPKADSTDAKSASSVAKDTLTSTADVNGSGSLIDVAA